MPPLAYVRQIERHYDGDAFNRRGSARTTLTLEILGDHADAYHLMMVLRNASGETFMIQMPLDGSTPITSPRTAKKTRKPRAARPAPSCPIFPLPAPREPSRWDYLEVE